MPHIFKDNGKSVNESGVIEASFITVLARTLACHVAVTISTCTTKRIYLSKYRNAKPATPNSQKGIYKNLPVRRWAMPGIKIKSTTTKTLVAGS